MKANFKLPGDCLFAFLIWLELRTGNEIFIDLFVAVMVTGGIFYTLYASVMNKMFKNNQLWRFINHG
jgi:hypothetical protein